jgi:ATP-dependent RNA helicase DeaD
LLDLLESKRLKNYEPSIVVLDEADEMLNMGFLEDVQTIFEFLPAERQTLLFSATLSDPIQRLIRTILKDPMFIKVGSTGFSHQDIEHIFYDLKEHKRENAFFRILLANNPTKAIVFCRTKKDVDDLSITLSKMGFPVRCLHGDIQQSTRQQVTTAFRKGEVKFLIATDVAARGLDISDVSHIFNYQIPFGSEEYVHRAGRTGRAGRKGVAITLGTANELRKIGRMLGPKTSEIKILSVPTAKQMYQIQADAFTDVIAKQTIREGVSDLQDKLMEKVEAGELVSLLLSYLMDKEKLALQEEDKFQNPKGGKKEYTGERRRDDYGSRPRREGFGDRPRREGFGDRPKRAAFGDRPQRAGFEGKSEKSAFGDKPKRASFGDRPPRKEGFSVGDRPKKPSFSEGRSAKPRGKFGGDRKEREGSRR